MQIMSTLYKHAMMVHTKFSSVLNMTSKFEKKLLTLHTACTLLIQF